ncbi:MAG: SURF1 family protein [Anaerolineales bacterium]
MTIGLLFSRRWLLTTFLVLVGVAVCIRLGFWQLDRLEQRRTFNAHVQDMRSLPPLDLNQTSNFSDITRMEYRAAIARGRYDYEAQVALRNQYYEGQYGYHLLTPLLLDNQIAILVDRGWIPAEGNASPVDWRKYDEPTEIIAVRGILRLGHPQRTPENSAAHLDFWMFVDLEKIGKQIPYLILPAYLQLDPQERTTPPIPYQPTLDLSEGPHLGYAIQWFTFAAILLFGYPVYVRKQEEHPPNALPSEKSNGHKC